jgi:hypothetical protein
MCLRPSAQVFVPRLCQLVVGLSPIESINDIIRESKPFVSGTFVPRSDLPVCEIPFHDSLGP